MRRLGTIQIVALIAVAVVMRLLYTHRKIQAPRPQSIPSNTAGNGTCSGDWECKHTEFSQTQHFTPWQAK